MTTEDERQQDPDRVATKDDLTELRGELQLDNARQTRQLTLTVLGVFLAQFVALTGVVATLS